MTGCTGPQHLKNKSAITPDGSKKKSNMERWALGEFTGPWLRTMAQ